MTSTIPIYEATFGDYTFSTDRNLFHVDWASKSLLASYWGHNRTAAMIHESFQHSLICGVYKHGRQVGMTRVITDYATFAYLCDVFLDEAERGSKVGVWMVGQTLQLPLMPPVHRWILFTQAAQELYRTFGFENPKFPERVMEWIQPAKP